MSSMERAGEYVMVNGEETAAADTSSDAALARELQLQLDAEARSSPPVVVASRPPTANFKCGKCGLMHTVQGAAPGSEFVCTRCAAVNRIGPNPTQLTAVIIHRPFF